MIKSFSFPNMLGLTTSNLISEKEAIRSNMVLLFSSERDTLFGDPYFGSKLKRYIFQQSGSIVPDILIDELYSTATTFMPQIYLTRKDITVYCTKTAVYADIKYVYVVDNTSDLFTIKLTEITNEGQ